MSKNPNRKWTTTVQTRKDILRAAAETFRDKGFERTSVAEIVERSGCSNGSIYHHFGGKDELFFALWEEFQGSQEKRTSAAVAEAKQNEQITPFAAFLVGARTYLEGAWKAREVVRLFNESDAPARFAIIERSAHRDWMKANYKLLMTYERPKARIIGFILRSIMKEARVEVAIIEKEEEAEEFIDAVMEILEQIPNLDSSGTILGNSRRRTTRTK